MLAPLDLEFEVGDPTEPGWVRVVTQPELLLLLPAKRGLMPTTALATGHHRQALPVKKQAWELLRTA